jgi:hypothetical protein
MNRWRRIHLAIPLVVCPIVFACAPGHNGGSGASSVPAAPPAESILQAPKPVDDTTRHRLEAAIENAKQRDLLTTNGFWTVFHGILGLGPAITLRDPATDVRVNAVDYISDGGELRGLQFIPTKHGLDVQMGPTMIGQGHQDQYVAEMAQWGMRHDRKFLVFGRPYTFMDFIRHTQMRARTTSNQELGWAIIVIAQYLGTEFAWTNEAGERICMEDMLRYELALPTATAACGGTHRLFGLVWVQQLHQLRGGKIDTGVWKEISEATVKHRDLAKKHQNADGSFSTDFFVGPANVNDAQRRINTTGHTLEWLALALSDQELREPWMQSAANAAALQILDLQGSPIEGGSLYHSVHGLLIYYARVYGKEKLGPHAPVLPKDVVDFLVEQVAAPRAAP